MHLATDFSLGTAPLRIYMTWSRLVFWIGIDPSLLRVWGGLYDGRIQRVKSDPQPNYGERLPTETMTPGRQKPITTVVTDIRVTNAM